MYTQCWELLDGKDHLTALEGKGKEQQVSIPKIFTAKPEDFEKPNSAKSIIQRTHRKNVVNTLAQSRGSNMTISL